MSAEALPPAIGITPEGAIIEQPQPNASSSQDIPAHSAPSAAPIDPLLSHEALSQGVHTNTAPEKDVRFLPPSTRLSLNSLLPKEESPAVANEEEKSKPLETSDAVGGVTGIVGGMVASRETVDAGVDAGVETESPIRPAEFEVEVPKTGWEMDMDVSAILNRKNNTHPYIAACKQASVVPVSYILDRLDAAEIIMPHHGLGPKGAEAFAKVLGSNPTLKHLDLMYNGIEAGGAEIGRSLQINRALTTLVLTGNRLGFDGSAEIADMLQFNSTLAVLILKENNIGDKEAQLFAEGLRHNSSLHTLDLSDNQIGDIGAIALGVGLSGNDSLRDLNLSWNHIRQRGIAGLLNGIKDNNMMTSLNLEANGIGDNGQAVAMFLSKNNIVQVLNLRRTRLSDAALAPIAKVLEQNYGIKELDISDNSWSHVAAPALFKALLNSTSIEKLYMRVTSIFRIIHIWKLAPLIHCTISLSRT
ncbi:uncharacterized protein EV422DRAFT_529974 [Fimicolochytrium jonesii]|uniref:uncharacterized protein n=1 Tax=Fimicolochytrium jonesii TaxID=1396493 RepID=UPI0022FDBF22|nr:uncharacterized protein EV422DRAFT_529974 [Fimicolochytrium jonesii]KAI8820740.1 hypothetical protein EV422DRAFT_529974 [Fimicolochytrium jonesii]